MSKTFFYSSSEYITVTRSRMTCNDNFRSLPSILIFSNKSA